MLLHTRPSLGGAPRSWDSEREESEFARHTCTRSPASVLVRVRGPHGARALHSSELSRKGADAKHLSRPEPREQRWEPCASEPDFLVTEGLAVTIFPEEDTVFLDRVRSGQGAPRDADSAVFPCLHEDNASRSRTSVTRVGRLPSTQRQVLREAG